jgi:hypothetical protein
MNRKTRRRAEAEQRKMQVAARKKFAREQLARTDIQHPPHIEAMLRRMLGT